MNAPPVPPVPEQPAPGLVRIHLLALPVAVAVAAAQHVDELLREFALLHASGGPDGDPQVPARLLALVDDLTARFAGVGDAARERLEDAHRAGQDQIDDHVLDVPPEAGPASEALGAMLDEADEFCAQGQHLLTLGTPPRCLAYRRWYLGQVISQLAGAAPEPWPDARARLLAAG